MKCLARGSIAGDLRIDPCSSCFGMFVFLEGEHPRALGENETVAIGRERSRGPFGLVVPRLREGPDHCVTLYDSFRDRRVDATRHENRLHTGLNVLIGVAESIGGRGAARGNDVAVSAET